MTVEFDENILSVEEIMKTIDIADEDELIIDKKD